MIKKTIRNIIGLTGYKVVKKISNFDSCMDRDDEMFNRIYEKCNEYSMTSKERKYALYQAVKYIVNNNIKGDFVECGTWKGGSCMIIAETLKEMKQLNRKIYVYDTFEGMPKPTEEDYRLSDHHDTLEDWEKFTKEDAVGWVGIPLEEVKTNMYSTDYPKENIIFVKGKVEDTIPKTMPKEIALLRLDTDWYESTKHELEQMYPLLVKNGVLIIDDYGTLAGSKKATDEYFKEGKILLNRIDCAGRIVVKI